MEQKRSLDGVRCTAFEGGTVVTAAFCGNHLKEHDV
jgi:hypothetical protein